MTFMSVGDVAINLSHVMWAEYCFDENDQPYILLLLSSGKSMKVHEKYDWLDTSADFEALSNALFHFGEDL